MEANRNLVEANNNVVMNEERAIATKSGGASNFLSDIQVKEYNEVLYNAMRTKARMSLGPVEEVENSIDEYFQICSDTGQIPSIKALALYIGVTLKTLEKYMYDVTSPYYNTLSLARDMCHVIVENCALNNKVNPATYMFTAANYYGMKNTQSVEINKNNRESSEELEKASDALEALKNIMARPEVRRAVDAKSEDAVIKDV